MSPTGGKHGLLELYLGSALHHFVQEHSLGWVMTGEVGIYTRRNPDRVRGADVVFLSSGRWPEAPPMALSRLLQSWWSKSCHPTIGGKTYGKNWSSILLSGSVGCGLSSQHNRTVLVFRSITDMQQYGMDDMLAGEGLLEGFTLTVANLFVL